MMAEGSAEQHEEKERDESAEIQLIDPNEGDWFLREMVDNINASEHGEGGTMTLMVNGMLVCGALISGPRYFELIGAELAGDLEGQEREDAMRPLIERAERLRELPDTGLPSYIHMADVRLHHHSGRAIPNNQPVIWRGRIRDVSGFWFGRLSSSVESGG